VTEEEPHSLWVALKGRYEHQKAILLPEANHEWTQIHLHDFKSIEEYNHAIHKVYAKLRFCEKEPSEEDKIEKTLQTILPSDQVLHHQYRVQNYQHYADLIRDLLQAEKHDELTIKNHHQCRVGAAPLLEIHHNKKKASASKDFTPKKNGRSTRHCRNRPKNIKLSKSMKKDGASSKGNNVQYKACETFKHTTDKCRTPKHLVTLYQKSLGKEKKVQGSGARYEAHFTILMNSTFEASCSSKDPQNPSTNEPTLNVDDYMDSDNTMVEYNSNDMFGNLL
jgi:hypothetical protein